PPPIEFEMPYNEQHVWRGGDFHGVSLQRWVSILDGYKLVVCNENGVNAFFVRSDRADKFGDVPTEIADIFRIGHFHGFARSGHVTRPETVRLLATRPLARNAGELSFDADALVTKEKPPPPDINVRPARDTR